MGWERVGLARASREGDPVFTRHECIDHVFVFAGYRGVAKDSAIAIDNRGIGYTRDLLGVS